MRSTSEVITLLDSMIANKESYLQKKENPFIKKEVEQLITIKDVFKSMEHLISITQLSYKLLLDHYERDFEGKLKTKDLSLDEIKDTINRLTRSGK